MNINTNPDYLHRQRGSFETKEKIVKLGVVQAVRPCDPGALNRKRGTKVTMTFHPLEPTLIYNAWIQD